jgi:AbrB family looped-hinge helix DNA binding protein
MPRKRLEPCCGISPGAAAGKYQVESLITVDERGQTVLPKEIREKAQIRPGDKLALMTWEKEGKVCCLFLIKAEELAEMAKGILGPMARELNG